MFEPEPDRNALSRLIRLDDRAERTSKIFVSFFFINEYISFVLFYFFVSCINNAHCPVRSTRHRGSIDVSCHSTRCYTFGKIDTTPRFSFDYVSSRAPQSNSFIRKNFLLLVSQHFYFERKTSIGVHGMIHGIAGESPSSTKTRKIRILVLFSRTQRQRDR